MDWALLNRSCIVNSCIVIIEAVSASEIDVHETKLKRDKMEDVKNFIM
jgi:hypothetical protein